MRRPPLIDSRLGWILGVGVACACSPGANVGPSKDPVPSKETGSPPDSPSDTGEVVVRMADFFPVIDGSRLYRVASGRIYLRHVLETVDERLSLAPDAPGGTHYVLHDYVAALLDLQGNVIAGSYDADEALFYADTWHMRNDPDGAVSEVADSFAITDAHWNPEVCPTPCLGRVNVYQEQVIGHGRPGGHTLGEDPFVQDDIQMWLAADGTAPPVLAPEYRAWSSVQFVEQFDSFKPAYGRGKDGFGAGMSSSWPDVIVVMFGHGATYPGLVEPDCPNQPAETPHVPGYSSFWQRLTLGRGVGWIQVENLFYEPLCDGTLTGDPEIWSAYIDTFDTCANPSPEVVVNTCREVGYPADWVGSYTSTRQYLCATDRYTEWAREDTCHAP